MTDLIETAQRGDYIDKGWWRTQSDEACDTPRTVAGWWCSRSGGHQGQHVAVAGGRVCEVWAADHDVEEAALIRCVLAADPGITSDQAMGIAEAVRKAGWHR